jgi:hypothetical protein
MYTASQKNVYIFLESYIYYCIRYFGSLCYKDNHRFEFRDYSLTLLAFTLFGNNFIAAVIYEIDSPNVTNNTNE